MATCPKYNRAMVPSFIDKEEFEELIRWLYDTTTDPTTKTLYNEAYSISIWIPFRFENTVWSVHYSKLHNFSDTVTEGQFTNFYDGKRVDTKIGFTGSSLIDPTRNCAILVPMWNGWRDWQCKIPPGHVISCACEHPGQMYLQLRGLCPHSNIDRFYVPKNKKGSGAFMLLGLDTTTIEYSTANMVWKLVEHSQNVTATTAAPLASYVLGSQEWVVENDNRECNKKVDSNNKVFEMSGCQDDKYSCTGALCNRKCSNIVESYKTVLKLTGCREGEFTCSDGQCIRMEERCDQIMDCEDKSDEDNCKLIVFEDNYNDKVPPFTVNKTDKSVIAVKVNVSTSLMNILAISEFDHTIHFKLGITLKWYENRVLYHNLKDSEALNTLTDSEVSALS